MARIDVEANQCKCTHGHARHAEVRMLGQKSGCLIPSCSCENYRIEHEDNYVKFDR